MEYVNLDLELSGYQKDASNEESFRVHVVQSGCGPMKSDNAVVVRLAPKERERISSLKERGLRKEEMIERGEVMGRLLFPPGTEVRSTYDECLKNLDGDRRLRIRLMLGNYALSDLPWEFAYILPPDTPEDQKDLSGFLVLDKRISLVRFPLIGGKIGTLDPVGTGKLRMVVIMANPEKS